MSDKSAHIPIIGSINCDCSGHMTISYELTAQQLTNIRKKEKEKEKLICSECTHSIEEDAKSCCACLCDLHGNCTRYIGKSEYCDYCYGNYLMKKSRKNYHLSDCICEGCERIKKRMEHQRKILKTASYEKRGYLEQFGV